MKFSKITKIFSAISYYRLRLLLFFPVQVLFMQRL